jgi:multidrug efflux pump subunit AcrA (membrane-fusion protein)
MTAHRLEPAWLTRATALVGVAVLGLLACQRAKSDPAGATEAAKSARAVALDGGAPGNVMRTAKARAVKIAGATHYVGEIVAEATIDLMTSVGGRLVAVLKNVGDPVKKGEVVARMDDEEIRKQLVEGAAAIEAARANVQRAKAETKRSEVEVRRATTEYHRNRPLFERQVIPAATWDAISIARDAAEAALAAGKAAVAAADTQVKQAEARVETGKVQLRNTRVRAPFAGVVNQRYLEPGAFLVNMNPRPILQIVGGRSVLARFKVPERDLREVGKGKKVLAQVEAYPGETFRGEVIRLPAALEVATRSALIEARFANEDGKLKPGMFARMEVEWLGSERGIVVVPQRAVRTHAEDSSAFVWVRDATAQRKVPVRVGRAMGDDLEVSGIEAGTTVVVSGAREASAVAAPPPKPAENPPQPRKK